MAKRAVLSFEKNASKRRFGLGRPFVHNLLFVVRIRLAHALQDALPCIARATSAQGGGAFYKELKVVFDNEEGVDHFLIETCASIA